MTTQANTKAQQLWNLANRHAGWLFLLGLGAVVLKNWRQWQRDQERQLRYTTPAPVPDYTTWPRQPLVSVLVAAWNEADNIETYIESFLALCYPHKQLVLCAGGGDGTHNLAINYAADNVIILEQRPGEGKQRALRFCLQHAAGELLYLTDADCELNDDAFLRLVARLATTEALVATGSSEPKINQRIIPLVRYQWLIDVAWAQSLPEKVDGVLGRNCALKRTALEQIGGFDADVATGTDYFMSRRLTSSKIDIYAVGASKVATEYPTSALHYLRMWRRWNKNLLVHGVRFGAWRDVRNLLAAGLIYAGIIALVVLTPAFGWLALATSLLLFATAALNRLRQVAAGAQIANVRLERSLVIQAIKVTAFDMASVLLALHDVIHPEWRRRW